MPNDAQLVKERVSIKDIVGETVRLEERGPGDYWGCCPFHEEDTASFHVRESERLYKCFGCGEGGDVIAFVEKTRGLEFRDALAFLADRAGIQLEQLTPEQRRRSEHLKQIGQVLEKAQGLFTACLFDEEGNPALTYLRGRGFSEETIKDFGVGFIPKNFLQRMESAGVTREKMGLVGFTQQFAGRLAFSIRDRNGKLVGFGARALDDSPAKYVNTKESDLFQKRRLLYGLDKAVRSLTAAGRLVVMEGYTDVMMAHQQGLACAVAAMGTSLTQEQFDLVKGSATNLIFLFDSDEAGQRAAERALGLALSKGRECRVLSFAKGEDPCEWFAAEQRTLDDFDAHLDQAGVATASFLARCELSRCDKGQPGYREQVARIVLEKIAPVLTDLDGDRLCAEVADACGLSRSEVRRTGAVPRPQQATEARRGDVELIARPGHPISQTTLCDLVAVVEITRGAETWSEIDSFIKDGTLKEPHAITWFNIANNIGPESLDTAVWAQAIDEQAPDAGTLFSSVLCREGPFQLAPSGAEALSVLKQRRIERQSQEDRNAAVASLTEDSDQSQLKSLMQNLEESARREGRVASEES